MFSFQGCVSRTRIANEGATGRMLCPGSPSLARPVGGRQAEAGTPAGVNQKSRDESDLGRRESTEHVYM